MRYDDVADAARSTLPWVLHTNGGRGLALSRGRGLLAQQNAGDSILPQLLGVMHVPLQHAPLLPQLTPVVPADGQIKCVNARLTCRSSAILITTTKMAVTIPCSLTTFQRAEPTARSTQVGGEPHISEVA